MHSPITLTSALLLSESNHSQYISKWTHLWLAPQHFPYLSQVNLTIFLNELTYNFNLSTFTVWIKSVWCHTCVIPCIWTAYIGDQQSFSICLADTRILQVHWFSIFQPRYGETTDLMVISCCLACELKSATMSNSLGEGIGARSDSSFDCNIEKQKILSHCMLVQTKQEIRGKRCRTCGD